MLDVKGPVGKWSQPAGWAQPQRGDRHGGSGRVGQGEARPDLPLHETCYPHGEVHGHV